MNSISVAGHFDKLSGLIRLWKVQNGIIATPPLKAQTNLPYKI